MTQDAAEVFHRFADFLGSVNHRDTAAAVDPGYARLHSALNWMIAYAKASGVELLGRTADGQAKKLGHVVPDLGLMVHQSIEDRNGKANGRVSKRAGG